MMRKVYTAQEMREMANEVTRYDCHVAADMLRQAADMIEHEAKRERKYEYTLRTSSGHSVPLIPTTEEQARRHMLHGDRLIRREIGEWEEVKE